MLGVRVLLFDVQLFAQGAEMGTIQFICSVMNLWEGKHCVEITSY